MNNEWHKYDMHLYRDSFQNYKVYQIPKAQLIIAAVECNHDPDHGRLKEYSPYTFFDPDFGRVEGKGKITMDWLVNTLLVPEDQTANVKNAASMVHAMMVNNFACGAFQVEGDAKAFAEVMKEKISTNPWICGQPEKMVVVVIDDFVLAMFGVNDAVNPFETKLTTAYPTAEVVVSEAING